MVCWLVVLWWLLNMHRQFNIWNETCYFGGFSNEQAQGNAYYYTQFPYNSNLAGWSSHHGPEGIQPSGYDQYGCYYGYQPAVDQSSTGSGEPAGAARNNGWGYQDLRKKQFFPRSSFR